MVFFFPKNLYKTQKKKLFWDKNHVFIDTDFLLEDPPHRPLSLLRRDRDL